jgi:predicted transcriptional regulator
MPAARQNGNGARKSILELAPLECDCMNALWALGEASVHQIRDALAPTRPRAYTTIMTIMDRLAHKGVVARHKVGKAYFYAPNLSAEDARSRAVAQLVESFFGGSRQELTAHLSGSGAGMAPATPRPPVLPAPSPSPRAAAPREEKRREAPAAPPLDATLL